MPPIRVEVFVPEVAHAKWARLATAADLSLEAWIRRGIQFLVTTDLADAAGQSPVIARAGAQHGDYVVTRMGQPKRRKVVERLRLCVWCATDLGADVDPRAQYCSPRCRVAAWRTRRKGTEPRPGGVVAIELLEAVGSHPGVGLGELSQTTGISRRRTYLLLGELERRGLVVSHGAGWRLDRSRNAAGSELDADAALGAVASLQVRPGKSISELADDLGVERQRLRELLPVLELHGLLWRSGVGWYIGEPTIVPATGTPEMGVEMPSGGRPHRMVPICGLCGAGQARIGVLFTGIDGAICDGCVATCAEALANRAPLSPSGGA